MAKSFHSLIRLHQWRVDEKRRALGALLGQAVELEGQAQSLETEIVNEKQAAMANPVEAGMFYGAYAAAAVQRRGRIAAVRTEVENEIVGAQDEVREEYRDLKSLELSQETRDAREEKERLAGEQAILDEMGLERHRRRD